MNHTQGEWKVSRNPSTNTRIIKSDKILICDLKNIASEREANSKLIAAAPDLLEALQFAVNMLDYKYDRNELTTDDLRTLRTMKAAIKKATD